MMPRIPSDPITSRSGLGPAPLPGDWLARWNVDPVLLTVLALCALWAFRLPGRARFSAFSALTVLTIVFVSPLCALSSALFSA